MQLCQNILTVDVEDWYHVCGVAGTVIPPRETWRLNRNIKKLLATLTEYNLKGTFFILGSVAESDPALAPMIAEAGHEIASHGFSHTMVTLLKPDQFRDEIKRTDRILVEQTGQKPVGYRAPQWSLSEKMPWAFQILKDEGYLYDSSLNPLPFIGNKNGNRAAFRLNGHCGNILELPPMVTPSMLGNIPTGGGWGFRFFPMSLITKTIDDLNRVQHPAVLYVHPREIDPDGPRLELPLLKSFVSYGTRADALPRLEALFNRYRFTTLKEVADNWLTAS
jgi:polysaccharide deacetylase family protein (PEP-CTERM system associated)